MKRNRLVSQLLLIAAALPAAVMAALYFADRAWFFRCAVALIGLVLIALQLLSVRGEEIVLGKLRLFRRDRAAGRTTAAVGLILCVLLFCYGVYLFLLWPTQPYIAL